ncbi:MAG TPA: hypothetical protein VFB04_17155 [Terriglobales bacterium]|nr:hypothetical protein [Terriglobales bacterium]
MANQERPAKSIRPEDREFQLQQRLLARERLKVFGVLLVVILILALAFLRFGKTIPWGAR